MHLQSRMNNHFIMELSYNTNQKFAQKFLVCWCEMNASMNFGLFFFIVERNSNQWHISNGYKNVQKLDFHNVVFKMTYVVSLSLEKQRTSLQLVCTLTSRAFSLGLTTRSRLHNPFSTSGNSFQLLFGLNGRVNLFLSPKYVICN